MVNNPKFSVQLLEKIGRPLAAAVHHVADGKEETEVESAKIMAQLLGASTQMSATLSNALDIKEKEDQFDSTRLALATLVSPLIADFYIQRKQIPTEDDIKQIGQSLEAVISFGENFSPAADHQSRLQTIDHDAVLFDKDQPTLVVLQGMVPVINAVEEFSFGQSQKKLVQDITTRLEARATDIGKKIGATDKLKELIIFKALADLYSSCHREETRRVSSLEDETKRGELSLDPIWESFETKVAMIEAIMGVETANATDQVAPKVEAKTAEKAADVETVEVPPAAPPQVEEPSEQAAPPSSGSPMGFFKKPTDETPAEPAAQEAAPAEAEKPVAEETESAPPSSPMGFFKKPTDEKEDSKTG